MAGDEAHWYPGDWARRRPSRACGEYPRRRPTGGGQGAPATLLM